MKYQTTVDFDKDYLIYGQMASYHPSSATFTPHSIVDAYDEIKGSVAEDNFIKYIEKEEKKQRITRENAINDMSEAYNKKTLVFVLGAGISIEHDVPNWNKLLQKLLTKALENDGIESSLAEIFAKMYLDQFSKNPLITARYIRKHIGGKKYSLERETDKILYNEISRRESSLFKQILAYCDPLKPDQGLDSIITYNYDDLIEKFCDISQPKILYKSRYSKNTGHGKGLPIHHVHGYLNEGKKPIIKILRSFLTK